MTRYISTFPSLPLTFDCTVVWEARDPVTDEPVSGVVIENPVLYGLNLLGGPGQLAIGPYQLVPGPKS